MAALASVFFERGEEQSCIRIADALDFRRVVAEMALSMGGDIVQIPWAA